MGLASVVRKAVAVADRVTQDLQVDVTITPVTKTGDGTEVAGTPYVQRGVVERRQVLQRQSPAGMVMVQGNKVVFPRPVEVGPYDRLADALGDLGPVLFRRGQRDAGGTTFTKEVWCGGSRGSSLGN